MVRKNHTVSDILKQNGHSVTKARLLVFELLKDSEPLSMHELQAKANGRIDRASLYRIITLFEELGIVSRINIGWKYKVELSDRFADHHHHLTCLRCEAIIPINESDLESFIAQLAAQQQFMPLEHQIEIQGYCQNCQPT